MSEPSLIRPGPEGITFRPGTLADLGSFAIVMDRAYAGRDNLELPSVANEDSIKELLQDMDEPGVWSSIAHDACSPCGFVLSFPATEPVDTVAGHSTEYLSLLMVDPEYWGRGIAGQLLGEAELRAYRGDKQYMTLWTRQANNQRSQTLYERRSYVLTGETKEDSHYGAQVQYRLDLQLKTLGLE